MIFVIIVLGVFLGDLMLKKYVEANLPEGEERTFLGGRIRIRKLHNRGIALGALSERPALIRKGTAEPGGRSLRGWCLICQISVSSWEGSWPYLEKETKKADQPEKTGMPRKGFRDIPVFSS